MARVLFDALFIPLLCYLWFQFSSVSSKKIWNISTWFFVKSILLIREYSWLFWWGANTCCTYIYLISFSCNQTWSLELWGRKNLLELSRFFWLGHILNIIRTNWPCPFIIQINLKFGAEHRYGSFKRKNKTG